MQDLNAAIQALDAIKASAAQGSLLRDGITVVIAGKPNVGKSSLLNRLSGKNIAIVTDIPGTTRDVLREQLTLDGMPIHVIDTAGLRESHDIVEQEGIRRAREEIAQADIILLVVDARDDAADSHTLFDVKTEHAAVVMVRNKIDLTHETPALRIEQDNQAVITLSAKEDIGIELLKNHIKSCVGFNANLEGCFSARRRHLDALSRAKTFLQTGQQQLQLARAGELLAEDLRQAQLALNEITGEFSSDDLLGRIFSSFCIGK
jgi:tRNA modification GTPase